MNQIQLPASMEPATQPISCRQSTVLVSLLRDQDIEPEQTRQLNQHIQNCVRCQAAKQQFEVLFSALDALLSREG
jgi:hypothetical protein